MRILISNVYSWQNKGDAAIVLCLLEHVREQFPDAQIQLSTHDLEDAGKYGDYPVQPHIISLLKDRYGGHRDALAGRLRFALGCLVFRLKLQVFKQLLRVGVRAYGLFPPELADKLRSYEACDAVIACGGGYLITKSPPRKLECLLHCHHLFLSACDFYLAELFGRPYLLYNQSVGPFCREADVRVLRKCLARAQHIICREGLTYERLKGLGLDRLTLSADIAFTLRSRPCTIPDELGIRRDGPWIGVTARQCLSDRDQDEYERQFAAFVERRIRTTSAAVLFMPQAVFAAAGDDDLVVARRIRERVTAELRERVTIFEHDLHPGELQGLIGQMDFFVGTRMHSNIFALTTNVRSIAISYEPKTEGIMRMLGLSEYVLTADALRADALDALFEKLAQDRDYLPQLARVMPQIRERCKVDLRQFLTTPGPSS